MSLFIISATVLCCLSLTLNAFQILKGFDNARQGAITLAHAIAVLMIVLEHTTKTPH